jgi:hypothetical protein
VKNRVMRSTQADGESRRRSNSALDDDSKFKCFEAVSN